MTQHQKSKPVLTLIIAVYNAVRYLEYILAALERQTMTDFEVIIADDGSGHEIKDTIERAKINVTFPIQHLWQEDIGFRKNSMLNKAIHASHADYLVFIDGDCVPHHKFLSDHWSNRQEGSLLCGRRMNLSKQLTDRLTLDRIRSGEFEKLSPTVWMDGFLARSSNLEDAIRLENSFLRKILHRNHARILGCNFSIGKKMLEQINGFNEEYHAPGIGEDTDIAFRLELTGANFITLRYLAVLYHLYHPATPVGDENRRIFEKVVEARNPVCPNGLRRLS